MEKLYAERMNELHKRVESLLGREVAYNVSEALRGSSRLTTDKTSLLHWAENLDEGELVDFATQQLPFFENHLRNEMETQSTYQGFVRLEKVGHSKVQKWTASGYQEVDTPDDIKTMLPWNGSLNMGGPEHGPRKTISVGISNTKIENNSITVNGREFKV